MWYLHNCRDVVYSSVHQTKHKSTADSDRVSWLFLLRLKLKLLRDSTGMGRGGADSGHIPLPRQCCYCHNGKWLFNGKINTILEQLSFPEQLKLVLAFFQSPLESRRFQRKAPRFHICAGGIPSDLPGFSPARHAYGTCKPAPPPLISNKLDPPLSP